MYDGERLSNGKVSACQLEVQTHVSAHEGIYFDGWPLAKQHIVDEKSVRGRGGGTFANHSATRCNAEVIPTLNADRGRKKRSPCCVLWS